MRRHATPEIEQFLRLLDKELARETGIVVIGGSAIALRYKTTHTTVDVDLWDDPGRAFWAAVDQVKKTLPIPVQRAAIAEAPFHFEDRLERVPVRGLKKLVVHVPERHDLALMKIARGEVHDLEAVEDIHRSEALSLDTLVARYLETEPQVMGPKSRFRLNFIMAVARLFGERTAERLEATL